MMAAFWRGVGTNSLKPLRFAPKLGHRVYYPSETHPKYIARFVPLAEQLSLNRASKSMFTELLGKLGSYLDFSKRLATTVPGLVMALALVLLTASVPDWARKPFVCGEIRSAEEEWQNAERTLDNGDLTKRALWTKESILRRTYFASLTEAQADPKKAPDVDTSIRALQEFYAGAGSAWKAEREGLSEPGKQAVARMEAADRTLASRDVNLCRRAVSLDGAGSELLMFGLLGFAFGVIFDPVNKALFIQLLPETATGLDKSRENPGWSLKSVLKPVVYLMVHRPSLGKLREGPLRKHSVQFFIGRGLITAGEYQELIDRSYRFSEVTTGLVVPVALIGIGVFYRYRASDDLVRAIAWLCAFLAASVYLARVGSRRYAEFREAVSDLISGRLEQLNLQQQREQPAVDIAQLQVLVHQADNIMGWWFRRDGDQR